MVDRGPRSHLQRPLGQRQPKTDDRQGQDRSAPTGPTSPPEQGDSTAKTLNKTAWASPTSQGQLAELNEESCCSRPDGPALAAPAAAQAPTAPTPGSHGHGQQQPSASRSAARRWQQQHERRRTPDSRHTHRTHRTLGHCLQRVQTAEAKGEFLFSSVSLFGHASASVLPGVVPLPVHTLGQFTSLCTG